MLQILATQHDIPQTPMTKNESRIAQGEVMVACIWLLPNGAKVASAAAGMLSKSLLVSDGLHDWPRMQARNTRETGT